MVNPNKYLDFRLQGHREQFSTTPGAKPTKEQMQSLFEYVDELEGYVRRPIICLDCGKHMEIDI